MSLRSVFSLGFIFIFATANPSGAEEVKTEAKAATAISQEVRHVFERCKTAVAKIEASDDHGKLAGTGFFIDPNGTLFTSYTIGGETHDITIQHSGKSLPAERLYADMRTGIAILKVDASTPFLSVGHSRALEIASPVVLIGYAFDLPISPSFGVIGGFDRKYLGRYFCTTHLRASLPLQGGQGGAPLLNMNGEVVGILVSAVAGGGAGFALPIEAAEKIRRDCMRFGMPRPGYLGAEVMDDSEIKEGSSARVSRIDTRGPAFKEGVQKNDILLDVAGRSIHNAEDVIDAAFYLSAGDAVSVTVLRDGEKRTLTMEAADRPTLQASAANPFGGAVAEGHPSLQMTPPLPFTTAIPVNAADAKQR